MAPIITTAPTLELDDELAAWRAHAEILERYGDRQVAMVLRDCADRFEALTVEYRQFLTIPEAEMRSGLTPSQLKRVIERYRGTPHIVGRGPGARIRACVVPRRHFDADAHRASYHAAS